MIWVVELEYNNPYYLLSIGKGTAMIRTIKKLTALLLTFALVFALLPSNAQAAGESTNTAVFQKGKTLHILAVGNSFSVDGLHYLYQMAESAGYDVVIGNLYKSGCDLKTHWSNLESGKTAYKYYKVSDANQGAWGTTPNATITQALEDEQWDVITLQQASGSSGVPESYYRTTWTCTTSGTTDAGRTFSESAASQQGSGSEVEPEPETSARLRRVEKRPSPVSGRHRRGNDLFSERRCPHPSLL